MTPAEARKTIAAMGLKAQVVPCKECTDGIMANGQSCPHCDGTGQMMTQ